MNTDHGTAGSAEPRTFSAHDDKVDAFRSQAYANHQPLSTADIERALQASGGDVHTALAAHGLPPLPLNVTAVSITATSVPAANVTAREDRFSALYSHTVIIDNDAPAKPLLARGRSYKIKRQSSHHWTPPDQYYSGPHEAAIRNGFLRKVYGIVCTQVLLTAAVTYKMMSDGRARVAASEAAVLEADTCTNLCSFANDGECDDHGLCELGSDCGDCGMRRAGSPLPSQQHWSAAQIAIEPLVPFMMPAFFASLFLICCLHTFKNSYPHNYLSLFAFTLVEAFTVGFVSVAIGVERPEVVYEAFALTAALFVGLTAFTMQSRVRFDFLGGFLLSSLLLLIAWGWINIALGLSFSSTAYSLVGAFLFCLFIIYDTSMICHRLGYDDYIVAAIELYLDVVNLFLHLLSLLSDN